MKIQGKEWGDVDEYTERDEVKDSARTMYGIYENGYDGRLLFKVFGKRKAQQIRADYIEKLIQMGEFRPKHRQILRESLEILPLKHLRLPVFKT